MTNADALAHMADTALAHRSAKRSGGERYQVVVHVDEKTLFGDDPDGVSELDDGPALAPETARRLACDSSLLSIAEGDGRTLDVGRKTRAIPPAMRRALAARDRGCRFPGCDRARFTDAHHIHHWARGGETKLDNLLLLCRHHHRLVHEGGFSVQRVADGGLEFNHPRGWRIAPVPPVPKGDGAGLLAQNWGYGPPIDPDTCWRGDGEPMNLGMCVDALLACAPPGPIGRQELRG